MANHAVSNASAIRLLATDVDGVLTDGGVYVSDDGSEFRRFNIKDGLGLQRVMAAGIHVAWISTSSISAISYRAQRLGVSDVHLGVENKLKRLCNICERLDIGLEQVAYIGDDLVDIPILEVVGLPCAPADAVDEVLGIAVYISTHKGGRGAVREICNYLLAKRAPI